MTTPNGLDEIVAQFGDVHSYVGADGTLSAMWQTDYLAHAVLPFSLPLDWNRAVTVNKLLCHKLMVDTFEQVFQQIVDAGLQAQIKTFGGCFMYRPQRTGNKLSTHSWGIAIDLNAFENAQGTQGNMSMDVVRIFRTVGFKWGGDWPDKRCDAMHFQFATDY